MFLLRRENAVIFLFFSFFCGVEGVGKQGGGSIFSYSIWYKKRMLERRTASSLLCIY